MANRQIENSEQFESSKDDINSTSFLVWFSNYTLQITARGVSMTILEAG